MCHFIATQGVPPSWSDVIIAAEVPTSADERKQRSHFTAAIKYMETGTPPKGKTIPTASAEFVRQQHDAYIGELDNRKNFLGTGKDKKKSVPRQPDPFRRQEVERAAVEIVNAHFTSEGYTVDSKEKDNLGWDLTAVRGRESLQLEVKGLSGAALCVELTPNEYAKMKSDPYHNSYRLCVVTSALSEPVLHIFAYSGYSRCWIDQDGRRLAIEEIIAARCRVEQHRNDDVAVQRGEEPCLDI